MNNTATVKPKISEEFKKTYRFILSEMKPKGKLITPFNVIAAIIILTGLVLIVIRFAFGLASVTNLNQDYPWGIWIGFDVVTGVAFAGGAYVLTFLVYILNLEKYKPIVRITVLNGFLAYVFYAGALLLDLGRPWNVINPVIGNNFGVSSVMFLVAWHFMLYMIAEFLEISPAIAEWLGWKKVRKWLHGLTLAAVIFGITLSTLHQSGLGALFMMAKSKIHPLWYTEFIPILFFVSSIFAGLSMVIFEGSISHRVFHYRLSNKLKKSNDSIVLGLAKICAGALFVYFALKMLVLIHDQNWEYMNTGWGYLYMLEIGGFVLLPLYLFYLSIKKYSITLAKYASALTMIGIIMNRLNTSVFAYNWTLPYRYYPSWMEIEITLAVIFLEIVVLRWIVVRMPILGDPPEWVHEEDKKEKTNEEKIELVKETSWKA